MAGAEMSEAIMRFCLAAAEEEQDEEQGPQSEAAMRELGKAIQLDKNRQPTGLGYMGNAMAINAWEVSRGSTRLNNVTFVT